MPAVGWQCHNVVVVSPNRLGAVFGPGAELPAERQRHHAPGGHLNNASHLPFSSSSLHNWCLHIIKTWTKFTSCFL